MHLPPELSLESFAPHAGTAFRLRAPGAPVALELVKAVALGHGRVGARTPFSLQFLGPEGHRMEQGTRTLEHPAMGPLDIFLVPLGPLQGRMRYEAIFS
ncbi:hypothetical protein FGE12_01110 [Aggregicoccus sp. 17bor-14]|uniref:DUF6916 family protein n=1 Tax=Myxococcaceae TaxID=31 RepID=UPI00129CC86B|nr:MULTISPECIES: hypothetical protein [Myxococcaceae]MBF5040972.1 hypothetical protein [Simulacricoccus sp. 17bor-14]MRI86760.1 hypothetical protein [Aggregicoccus sp. 17bor-14]